MSRYHDDFPAAPTALVSGVAGACGIPSIIGARVGRDGSVYLDIFEDHNYSVSLRTLLDVADFFQVEPEWLLVEPGPDPEAVTVVVAYSGFDFSAQFIEEDRAALPGEGDSEESVAAHAALAKSRRA